jgi:hypothetical protein
MDKNVIALPAPVVEPQAKVLRIFISYATEDAVIASALGTALRVALGELFAEVIMDRWSLAAGEDFRKQIKNHLQRTDVLISLYTGVNKLWPEWEVGFFEHVVMTDAAQTRRIVPIYLDVIPSTTANYQSIGLNISTTQLKGTVEEFTHVSDEINGDDPLCRFVIELQGRVDECIRGAGFSKPPPRKPEQDAVKCVRDLKLAIFQHLKSTVEARFEPQKQILIRTSGAALQKSQLELPDDAVLEPLGYGNTLSTIFGLTDKPRTWQQFIQETSGGDHVDSWRSAITSVITPSIENLINVDNSQVIVSNDATKGYRVILTSNARYYDGTREFKLCFVEILPRSDYGDEFTSLLLRAIDLTCRFRSIFFEQGSPFLSVSIGLTALKELPNLVSSLLRELDLLRKDAREAALDKPHVWLRLVDQQAFKAAVEEYQPREQAIRAIAARILAAKSSDGVSEAMRTELADALADLQHAIGASNATLIREMTTRLQEATSFPTGAPG